MNNTNIDKAGKKYWNNSWINTPYMPKAVNPHLKTLRNYVRRRKHKYFSNIFSCIKTHGKILLEIGCARSVWLPYFAKEFGFKVTGIDYSEVGCQQAAQILANEGVEGEIICADLFKLPESMLDSFDVVVTFGVVEHYENTEDIIRALARLLKPGGILITEIPNLTGLNGFLQMLLNKQVYDKHVPLKVDELQSAHENIGLNVLHCNYFLSINFWVLNIDGIKSRFTFISKKIFLYILYFLTILTWLMDSYFGVLSKPGVMSPYIFCAAKKD